MGTNTVPLGSAFERITVKQIDTGADRPGAARGGQVRAGHLLTQDPTRKNVARAARVGGSFGVRLRIVLAAAIVALGTLVSGTARADARSDLEKAHNAYVAHKYEDAEARLRTLLGVAAS